MEEMRYVFYFTFFFTAAHFHLALVAASISSRCSSNNVLVFIDSLVVSASQDAGGYAISRQNNIKITVPVCLLSYFPLVGLWCGRTVGRSVRGGDERSRHYRIFWDR